MSDRDRPHRSASDTSALDGPPRPAPGKTSRTERIVQRQGGTKVDQVQERAGAGVAGPGERLPFLDVIAASFGAHDVSGVSAHTDAPARAAAADIGATAYATGEDVAFAGPPDLHTAAHEAAHVVQQRGGVQLKGGVGQAGDPYEEHADAVADAVVAGQSAEPLLDRHAAGGRSSGPAGAVQRIEADDLKARGARMLERSRTAPATGMNLWVATCRDPAATIYLLGTNHGLRITQLVEWRALVGFLQSTPFTHVYSETTAEIDRGVMGPTPPGVLAALESQLVLQQDFAARFPHDRPVDDSSKARIDRLRATSKLAQANVASGGTGGAALDDAYVAMALTSGREHRPARATLETPETRDRAAAQNARDLGITPPPDAAQFERGEADPAYLEQRERYLRDNLKVTKGADEPETTTDDVQTGNQQILFAEQARELLDGRDLSNAEERNKQWVDRLKVPANLEAGDQQLWIVGAAHLPGLILRFEDLGWSVAHQGPLRGGGDGADGAERKDAEERKDGGGASGGGGNNNNAPVLDGVD